MPAKYCICVCHRILYSLCSQCINTNCNNEKESVSEIDELKKIVWELKEKQQQDYKRLANSISQLIFANEERLDRLELYAERIEKLEKE